MSNDASSNDMADDNNKSNGQASGDDKSRPTGAPVRVRNQYLMAILSSVVGLGSKNIAEADIIERWQSRDYIVDDIFFLHYDVLFSYGFMSATSDEVLHQSFSALLEGLQADKKRISITHEGREFLDRYGVV